MSPTSPQLSIRTELPPLAQPGDRPPAFVAGLSEGQYDEEEAFPEDAELLPAYTGPTSPACGRKRCQPRPFARYILAALSFILLATISQLVYCYVQTFKELVHMQVSLELADKRGYALASRVAWLESALEYNNVEVPETAVSSAAPGDLDPLKWRDTVDLAIAATELQERLHEMEQALVWCETVKGTSGATSEERRKEVFG